MLYLKRTSGLQPVKLHTTGLENGADGNARFRLYNTISGKEVADCEVSIVALAEYIDFRLALPQSVKQGEYRYELRQNDAIVGSGLAVVGAPTPIAEAATAGEGIETIVIEQYGE